MQRVSSDDFAFEIQKMAQGSRELGNLIRFRPHWHLSIDCAGVLIDQNRQMHTVLSAVLRSLNFFAVHGSRLTGGQCLGQLEWRNSKVLLSRRWNRLARLVACGFGYLHA